MIRWGFEWSARAVGAMPGMDLIRWGFGGCLFFLVPVPPQVPCGDWMGDVRSEMQSVCDG